MIPNFNLGLQIIEKKIDTEIIKNIIVVSLVLGIISKYSRCQITDLIKNESTIKKIEKTGMKLDILNL